jgi:phenylalanine-4-hydroxylase
MSKSRDNLPQHLLEHIVVQDYSLYTSIDQAVWRFIMKISVPFFKDHAHETYLKGLEQTGIPLEKIPFVDEMDEKLDRFGWGASTVKGFIPPVTFMELLSRRVLAIAVDMRTAEHIVYTPAPDIVHEAAGHAPIIADPDYADYLCNYGELAHKAIASKQDMELYEVIRKMSDLKENPNSTQSEITQVQKEFEEAAKAISWISEAAELARMNWWTSEYGLVGSLDDPKIYGAGLLSSVGESHDCLGPSVKKIPMNIDCIQYGYDITEPQPQLFVTKDFKTLSKVLSEFSKTMAYKTGGIPGLKKAKTAETVTTAVYDSGLQVSGVLSDLMIVDSSELAYIKYTGLVQLCYDNNEISGHSVDYHSDGFGALVGKISNIGKSLNQLSRTDLQELGIFDENRVNIDFSNGIKISGTVIKTRYNNARPLLISLEDCSVTLNDKFLFRPEWGVYDLACGGKIVSVFGGPADWPAYYKNVKREENTISQSSNLTDENKPLNELYSMVREMREKNIEKKEYIPILEKLNNSFPNDWLLLMEIYEMILTEKNLSTKAMETHHQLKKMISAGTPYSDIIERGLAVIHSQ